MRSIFRMPSDDMAGVAKRRVPIPLERKHFWRSTQAAEGSGFEHQ